jgi:hypothetical protein
MVRLLLVVPLFTGCVEYDLDGDPALEGLGDTAAPPVQEPGEVALGCVDDYNATMPWRRSEFWYDADQPKDAAGEDWWADDFDDTAWAPLAHLPDRDPLATDNDVFYRSDFWLDDVVGSTDIQFVGNDGVWLYVNETFVGHWGGEWRQPGCINVASGCGVNYDAPPADVTDLLQPGHNHIAVMLTNGPQGFLLDIQAGCSPR